MTDTEPVMSQTAAPLPDTDIIVGLDFGRATTAAIRIVHRGPTAVIVLWSEEDRSGDGS